MRQGGFIQIFVLALIAFFLFVPIPYYQYDYEIPSCIPGQVCPGFHFTKPLWNTIAELATSLTNVQTVNTTADPTASWIFYPNMTYGYELKYPKFLTPKEYINETYFDLVNFDGNKKDYIPFSVEVFQYRLEKSVEIFRSRIEEHIKVNLVENKSTTIDEFPAQIIKYASPNLKDDIKTTHIFIDNGEYTYMISSNSSISDQILSTFKFIKKSGLY